MFRVNGNLENADGNFLPANDPLYKRLKELYDKKFSYREMRENNCIELNLDLHE
jgi:hypothetical protein